MDSTISPFGKKTYSRSYFFQALVTICVLFFSVLPALAEVWYVKPSAEIPLRRGMGSDYKITAILQNGTQLSILEENAPWVKVVTPKGKEGWILKRYLEQDKPLNQVVENLRKENASLKEENASISSQMDEITGQNDNLKSDLTARMSELSDTQEQYQTLTRDTADVILLKENFDKSQETIETLKNELNVVTSENDTLRSNQNIKWFLAGGGTLIFGAIVGRTSARSKKRKSSLY